MPELPEVETVVSDLNRKVLGRRIIGVWFDAPKMIKSPRPREFGERIKGLKIEAVRRRGKNILIYLSGGFLLLVHQKMTGHFLVGRWRIADRKAVPLTKGPLEEKVNDYIHLIFYLDDGGMLALSDLRKFAKVVFGGGAEIENSPELRKLGPEPLASSFSFKEFEKLISEEKREIKKVLLDQEVISGIGNIYADEILWSAKIHPLTSAGELRTDELKSLYSATRQILKKAVRLRGTSTSDFRDTAGRPGTYTEARLVYRREGEPCRRCGAPIKRMKVGGRSAHYCPVCQKRK